MQGYRVMVQEVLEQSRGTLPTHVFIQGGVGGLAAAVIAHIVNSGLTPLPRFIVVEPNEAACLFESAAVGHPVAIEGDLDTIMAGLSCGEVSQLAWPTIASRAAAYMTIPDSAAVATMRLLADGRLGPPTVGGESAVAGLAGFLVAALNEDWREKLGLNRHSRILVFGTEGDTDPERYRAIVGASAREIQRRQ